MPTTISRKTRPPQKQNAIPPLEPGDTLDQATFHERYEAMPKNVKAELIGGKVYMASPVRSYHGLPHAELIGWLMLYKAHTHGTNVLDNTTTILGGDSEPQPDAALIIVGGQTKLTPDGYYEGAPELAAEIAASSVSLDLNDKKLDYEKYGVKEYLVVAAREKRVYWFVRKGKRFTELSPDVRGIYKSRQFPGLWLDAKAMLAGDTATVFAVLSEGLASAEHAKFVASLQ